MNQGQAAQMRSQGLVASDPKRTSANEVHDRLSALADYAQALADRTENALQSVSRQTEPTNTACEKVSQWYPPLFDGYLGRANSINNALMRIDSALDRLEL